MGFASTSNRPRAIGGRARPSNKTGNISPRINCCLEAEQFDAIAAEAERRGIPVSQVIRESVALRLRLLATDHAGETP